MRFEACAWFIPQFVSEETPTPEATLLHFGKESSVSTATLATRPNQGMAIGDVVYTYFLAVMHGTNGELRFDPSLTYPVPTGAFTTPVTMTPNGLVAVMSLDEQKELLEAPTTSGVRISRIVSTMHELEVLLAAPDYGADEPTRTEEAFYRMLRGITAANPTKHEE